MMGLSLHPCPMQYACWLLNEDKCGQTKGLIFFPFQDFYLTEAL